MKKTAKTGTVTDEQGRVRFHGAFTGGFSAGYYNTVGSSEGFQPAQFVSSRTNRASQPSGRSIADYMDEGDGLLGGKLSSVAGIDSFSRSGTEGIDQQRALEANSSILNKQLLSELTVQAKPSDTIGKTLLATMGWRLGQGIGPRTAKKRVDYFSQNSKALTVEVHPGADLSKLPSSALLKNGAVTFAPDDVALIARIITGTPVAPMNCTPCTPCWIMCSTALPPPPPTPITLICVPWLNPSASIISMLMFFSVNAC